MQTRATPSGRSAAVRLLRIVAGPVALVACAIGVAANWSDIADAVPTVGWIRFAGSVLLGLVGLVFGAIGWRTLLVGIGGPAPALDSVAVFGVSQLGKYIPGSVWPLVAQVSFARRSGRSRSAVVLAFTMQIVVSVIAAATTAAITLPLHDASALRSRWWLLLAVPVLFLCVRPPVLRRAIGLVERVLGRPIDASIPSTRCILAAIGWYMAGFAMYGLHLDVLAGPFAHQGPSLLIQCVGTFALAWVCGFLVILAPAGIGVREVVMAVSLASFMATSSATGLTVISRASLTLADLVFGASAALHLSRRGLLTRRGSVPEPS